MKCSDIIIYIRYCHQPDFAKVLDKVPHRRLLYKLDYYRKRESTHKWIISWLSGRHRCVVFDGQTSTGLSFIWCSPRISSWTGPILFLLMTFQIISGLQFACSQTTVSFTEIFTLLGIVISFKKVVLHAGRPTGR